MPAATDRPSAVGFGPDNPQVPLGCRRLPSAQVKIRRVGVVRTLISRMTSDQSWRVARSARARMSEELRPKTGDDRHVSPAFVEALEDAPYCWASVGGRPSGHDPPSPQLHVYTIPPGSGTRRCGSGGRLSAVLGA